MTDPFSPDGAAGPGPAQSATGRTPAGKIDLPPGMSTLSSRINDVSQLLRSQRELLSQRGINLPDSALENLRALRSHVDALGVSFTDSRIELRALRALAETSALINSALSTDEVLNQVMDTVIALMQAERGYLVVRNKDTDELEFRVARGMDQSQLDNSRGLVVSKTIVNRVAETGETILTDNASADDRYNSAESIAGFQLRSIVAVPLKVRDEVVGVVYCDNSFLSGVFRTQEIEVLNAFTHQAAVAIQNARLFEDAQTRLQEVTSIRDRMRDLFSSIANGVITADADDHVLIVNAAACSMLDIEEAPRDITLLELLPPLPDIFHAQLEAVKADGGQAALEVQVEVPGVGLRDWSLTLSPLYGEQGGVALVVEDLTEQYARVAQLTEVKRFLPPALFEHFRQQTETGLDLSGQEREITAMFADVRGFTAFSEALEPEELMQVINKYLSLASDAIGLYDGITDKYMGDAVTGLWNTQLNPQADHAVRAVSAALQLKLDLMAQHEVLPGSQQLFYGIGIHTGPAVIGNVGATSRKEFTALGEAPDFSKYLQEQAGEGEIIISQAVYDLVYETFACEQLSAPRRPKPGFEDVAMYRVIRRQKNTGSLFLDDELRALLGDDL